MYTQGYIWFNLKGLSVSCLIVYLIMSFFLTVNFYLKHK